MERSKHRREDVQPIARKLAVLLRIWLGTKAGGENVFAVPRNGNARKMMQTDLDVAVIVYETAEGSADLHSLRHTYITALVMGGENVKVGQELARHNRAKKRSSCGRWGLEPRGIEPRFAECDSATKTR